MLTKTIELREAQDRTSGVEIILTEGSIPIARLVPIVSSPMTRIAGLHADAIWTSNDFDEPLPEAFWVGNA